MRRTIGTATAVAAAMATLMASVALAGCTSNSGADDPVQSEQVVVQEDHGLRVPQSGMVDESDYYLPEPGEMKLSDEEAWSLYMNLACGVQWKADAQDEAFATKDMAKIHSAAEAYLEAVGWVNDILDAGFYDWPEESLPALVKLRQALEAGSEEAAGVLAAGSYEDAVAVLQEREPMPTGEMQRALGLTDQGAPSCTGYGDTLEELAEQMMELGQTDSE